MPLCLISADLSTLRNHMTRRKNAGKEAFWEFHYELLLGFGGPEMTAQIVWFEKVRRKRKVPFFFTDTDFPLPNLKGIEKRQGIDHNSQYHKLIYSGLPRIV